MKEHMREVKRRREERAKGDSESREIEDPVDNGAAAGLVVGG